MTDKNIDARDLLLRARENGHDAFGLAHDPEAWRLLADGSRERFFLQRDPADLEHWIQLTEAVVEADLLEPELCEWALMQVALLGVVSEPRPAQEDVASIVQTFGRLHPQQREVLEHVSLETRRMVEVLMTAGVTSTGAAALFRGMTSLWGLPT